MDRGHDGLGESLQPRDHLLPGPGERFALLRGPDPDELLDVGSGDEAVRLPGDQYDPSDSRVAFGFGEHRLQLARERRTERIHGLAGCVDRDDEDTVLDVGDQRRLRGRFSRHGS